MGGSIEIIEVKEGPEPKDIILIILILSGLLTLLRNMRKEKTV